MKYFLLTLVFLLPLLSRNGMSQDLEPLELRNALNAANRELGQIQSNGMCPGVHLTLTCGNKTCEQHENGINCPADCIKGEIRSYNHQTICNKVKSIWRPSQSLEISEAIMYARQMNQKVRVVGKLHSANGQLCSTGIVITTENLNQIHGLEMFQGEETVLVDGGVTLGELSQWLDTKNKSLGYTLIGFRGVSVAGSTATGSHGSSPKHNSVLANLIRSMTVVTADGLIQEFHEKNTPAQKWKALKTNLGMLGVVSNVRLKVIPQFNLHVAVEYKEEKDLFKANGLTKEMEKCDWGQVNWFPGSHKFVKICGKESNLPAEPGATNTLLQPDIPDFIVKPFKAVMQLGACSKKLNCLVENARYQQFKWQPYFKKLNAQGKLVSSNNVVGPSHMMTSSNFTDRADGFFQMDWEIAVPASKIHQAMQAVYEHTKKYKICLPLVGVFIRFSRVSGDTLIAHSSVGEEFKEGELVTFIEMPIYLPTGFPQARRQEYDFAYEEFARILVGQFGGRAHWAKNRNWIFKWQRNLGRMNDKLKAFQRVMQEMDPEGLFANQYAQDLGLRDSSW